MDRYTPQENYQFFCFVLYCTLTAGYLETRLDPLRAIPITLMEKLELGKFLDTIQVTLANSDVGVQNTYVQFIKELL